MARRKLKSPFLPRRARNVLHGPIAPLAPRDAFSSSCPWKHIRRLRAADRNNIPPHSSKHMRSVLVSRDDFTRSASDQNATESLSWGAEDTSASCADCSWDQCASHRHASSCTSGRASRHALNVEPPPLLVSRRWLDGDVQMSELHFPTES